MRQNLVNTLIACALQYGVTAQEIETEWTAQEIVVEGNELLELIEVNLEEVALEFLEKEDDELEILQSYEPEVYEEEMSEEEELLPFAPTAAFVDFGESCQSFKPTMRLIHKWTTDRGLFKCMKIGDGLHSSVMEDMDWQITQACHRLHNDPDFADQQINLVGFGQGGIIARGVVQKCPGLDVNVLFTAGTQHQGFMEGSNADQSQARKDVKLRAGKGGVLVTLFGGIATHIYEHFSEFIHLQDWFASSAYFESSHPGWTEEYGHSNFLLDLNNLLPEKNELYKERLLAVNTFAMVKIKKGSVYPADSQLFFEMSDQLSVIPLRFQELYKQDWLGLKQMTKENRIEWYFYSARPDASSYANMARLYLRPLLLVEKKKKKNMVRYQDVDAKFVGTGRRTSTRISNGLTQQ